MDVNTLACCGNNGDVELPPSEEPVVVEPSPVEAAPAVAEETVAPTETAAPAETAEPAPEPVAAIEKAPEPEPIVEAAVTPAEVAPAVVAPAAVGVVLGAEVDVEAAPVGGAPVDIDGVVVSREVKMEGRVLTDKVCAIIFGACVLLFVILSIVIGANARPEYEYKRGTVIKVGEGHVDDAKACCNKAGSYYSISTVCNVLSLSQWTPSSTDRRLTALDFEANDPSAGNVWEGFGLRPSIPIVIIIFVICLCVGFLKAMEKCSKTMLFGVFFLEFLGSLYLAIETGVWLFWLAALGIVVWCFVMRKKIAEGAVVISAAATALLNMPSLMMLVFSWLLVSGVLVVVLILVLAAAGQVSSIVSGSATTFYDETPYTTCAFKKESWVDGAVLFIEFVWNWMWFYANVLQIFFVAGCVGTYHFTPDKVTPALPFQMLKIGITTSFGTLGKLAMVTFIVDYIKKKSSTCSCKCCIDVMCCNPMFYLALLVRCCCLTYLNMITKFCLIYHVFSGEAFWPSALRTTELLKRAGLGALVLESAAANCFTVIGFAMSYGMGLFCWWWMGIEYSQDFTDPEVIDTPLMIILIILFGVMLLVFGAFGCVAIVVLIAVLLGDNVLDFMVPWLCGLFVSGVSWFFFNQTTQALLYAANTMFVAHAIDKATGFEDKSDNPLVAVLVTQIQEAQAVEAKAVAAAAPKA